MVKKNEIPALTTPVFAVNKNCEKFSGFYGIAVIVMAISLCSQK